MRRPGHLSVGFFEFTAFCFSPFHRPVACARSASAGFMLIELLIVLALILVMFTMYFSPGSKNYQRSKQIACRQNLQFIYGALQTYAAETNGFYPRVAKPDGSEAPLSLLVPRCTTRTEIFICPGSRDKKLPQAQPFANRNISYAYLMGLTNGSPSEQWLMSDAQANAKPKSVGAPLFSRDGKGIGSNHRQFGGNVLFCDGRIEFSPSLAKFELPIPTNAIPLNPKSSWK